MSGSVDASPPTAAPAAAATPAVATAAPDAAPKTSSFSESVGNGLSWYGRFRSALGLILISIFCIPMILLGIYVMIFRPHQFLGGLMLTAIGAVAIAIAGCIYYFTRKSKTFSKVSGGLFAISDAVSIARVL